MELQELGVATLRAGTNYLAQPQPPRSISLIVPAACGAALVRPGDGNLETAVEAISGDSNATVLCVARSPAAPEMLALACTSPSGGEVQVWQLPNRTAREASAKLITKLIWIILIFFICTTTLTCLITLWHFY